VEEVPRGAHIVLFLLPFAALDVLSPLPSIHQETSFLQLGRVNALCHMPLINLGV
jgi:hypothetical protein